MSLVEYENSSGEESGDEKPEVTLQPNVIRLESNGVRNSRASATTREPDEDCSTQNHLHLPAPKKANDLNVEEEDDEFLRKKAVPEATRPLPLVKPNVRNGKVQISIPSMKDFKDDEKDAGKTKKEKPVLGAELPKKSTNLLSLLPKPRTELFSAVRVAGNSTSSSSATFSKRLVPDSVANRPRNVPMSTAKPAKPSTSKPGPLSSHREESDEDDDGDETESVDFFSFNKVEILPTVSANEINAMVARKAAKIAETVRMYAEPEEQNQPNEPNETPATAEENHKAHASKDLANVSALASLIGGNRAKRARVEEVDLIEITSTDIVPSREDFLRRQLQDETGFVATGHLSGDWTCTSKRKSHITQLATKAQANAQELEAMWASNRQSRRQTQSKYGF